VSQSDRDIYGYRAGAWLIVPTAALVNERFPFFGKGRAPGFCDVTPMAVGNGRNAPQRVDRFSGLGSRNQKFAHLLVRIC